MIRPALQPFPDLPTTNVVLLLAYADREGRLKTHEGFQGELTRQQVHCLAQGALWICFDGPVVQRFQPGDVLLDTPEKVANPTGITGTPDVVGSIFTTGIFGGDRAFALITGKVLSELDAYTQLCTLSDDALEHAIGTNLRDDTSIAQHNAFILELEECARGTSELAQEIRTFIARMANRNDKTNRHNVYRMVMIVRAIQRRGFRITSRKHVMLKTVTAASIAVAKYIADTMAIAGRIVTELSDPHPWWYGEKGTLKAPVANRRRENFAKDLEGYAESLERIVADPVGPWTLSTAKTLRELVRLMQLESSALREEQDHVVRLAKDAVEMMRFVQYMERISRAMTLLRSSKGMHSEAVAVIRDVKMWRRSNAGMQSLGNTPEALKSIAAIEEWRMNDDQLIDHLRFTLELMCGAA